MDQLLLLLVVALTVAAVVFGVTVLVTGGDSGLVAAEPDGRSVPLPGGRPLVEDDVSDVRFDTAFRGYRMAQVDQALRRAAYDIGYKDELIGVLEAEVIALREGRTADADTLQQARQAALAPARRVNQPTESAWPVDQPTQSAWPVDQPTQSARPADQPAVPGPVEVGPSDAPTTTGGQPTVGRLPEVGQTPGPGQAPAAAEAGEKAEAPEKPSVAEKPGAESSVATGAESPVESDTSSTRSERA